MKTELIQGILDFETGNQDGLEKWRREREAMNRRIRDVWKVPLGRTVRMTLRNVPGSFEGKLTVAQQPKEFRRQISLQLQLGSMVFAHQEIESCSIID
jgi:hypothetical protein